MYDKSIGEILGEARQRLDKSIKEIELDTKIRAKYVEALERDDLEYLPGDIYAKGFIKTYATYLGLDPEPLLQQYKALHEQNDLYDLSHVSSNMRLETKKRGRWFKPAIALGVVGFLFVGLMVWGAYVSAMSKKDSYIIRDINTRGPNTTVAAAVTSTTNRTSATTASDDENVSSTTTTTERRKPKGDGKMDVIIKLTGIKGKGSWVRVIVDGERAFEGIIADGETKLFKGDEVVFLRVGYTPGLEIMLNGKKQPELKTLEKTFKKGSKDGER